jgi:hypothetical protein
MQLTPVNFTNYQNINKNPDPSMNFFKQTRSVVKNAQKEKSQDFCLMFMNSMEDGIRNPGSRLWT